MIAPASKPKARRSSPTLVHARRVVAHALFTSRGQPGRLTRTPLWAAWLILGLAGGAVAGVGYLLLR